MPNIPLLARVPALPGVDERLRRFTDLVSLIVNSLSRQDILRQTSSSDFTLDVSGTDSESLISGHVNLRV